MTVARQEHPESQEHKGLARPGDLEVRTKDFAFHPKKLSAEAGTLSVHLRNDDSEMHTFTIDDLGVSLAIPPGKETRTSFTVKSGQYKWHCIPHPDMTGSTTVS